MTTEDLKAAIDEIAADAIRSRFTEGVSPEFVATLFDVFGSIVINMQRQADALELIAERLKPEVNPLITGTLVPVDEVVDDGWVEIDETSILPPAGVRVVEVRLRGHTGSIIDEASILNWSRTGGAGDIVAYRVVT